MINYNLAGSAKGPMLMIRYRQVRGTPTGQIQQLKDLIHFDLQAYE